MTEDEEEEEDPPFYVPLGDGVSFENSRTGEIHACYHACGLEPEIVGDRVVCPLTKAVTGSAHHEDGARPASRKRATKKSGGSAEDQRARADDALRTSGFLVARAVLRGFPKDRCVEYVDRAMRVHAWLRENLPFNAVTYAVLMCAAEGVRTSAILIERDPEVAAVMPPLRSSKLFGVKQNAATRAYTCIMKRKGDDRIQF